MHELPSIACVLSTAGVCLAAIFILHPLAPRLGLMDHPGERRKIHRHSVAPIGGVCIFFGLMAALLADGVPSPQVGIGLLGAAVLVLIGALDDRFSLGYRTRMLTQIGAALILTVGAGVHLESLGNLLGTGPIELGLMAIPFSVFAVVGIINAFNMIDGIDGLAGGLVLVALVGLLLTQPLPSAMVVFLVPLICLALLPYLACNLGLHGFKHRKIFLGDAGSMLLGYVVAWALIDATQPSLAGGLTASHPYVSAASQGQGIAPITAIWLVALPLMDTFNVMGRRLLRRRSPFKADRGHLHHLLTRTTGSPRRALVIMLSLAVVLATPAIILQDLGFAEPWLFYSAIAVFIAYVLAQSHVPRFYQGLQRRRRQRRRTLEALT